MLELLAVNNNKRHQETCPGSNSSSELEQTPAVSSAPLKSIMYFRCWHKFGVLEVSKSSHWRSNLFLLAI